MPLLKWTVAGALVATLATVGTSAQVSSKLLVDVPYEIVPDHFKPNFPEGWTFGAFGGVYVESPDRIYVYQYGILPPLKEFVGADGKPVRDALRREGGRTEYVLAVYDRSGKRIDHWKEADALHQGKNVPHRIKVSPWDPEKHVWLVDQGEEGGVLKFTRSGKLVMRVGSEKGIGCQGAQDITFTPNGDFWCLEGPDTPHVIKFSKDGKRLAEFGKPGGGPGELGFRAHAITVDRRGRIYIGDRGNFRIQVYDQNGQFLQSWPGIEPFTLGIDKKNRLWAMCGSETCGANGTSMGMTAFDVNTGKALFTYGAAGGRPGELWWPSQFDVDRDGNLYVIESRGGRVQMFRPKKGANPDHLIAWPLDMREK